MKQQQLDNKEVIRLPIGDMNIDLSRTFYQKIKHTNSWISSAKFPIPDGHDNSNCECRIDSLGYGEHSSWCPKGGE